jgi:hypothetical protein
MILALALEPLNSIRKSVKTLQRICPFAGGQGYSAVSRQGEVLRFDRRLPTITNIMKKCCLITPFPLF